MSEPVEVNKSPVIAAVHPPLNSLEESTAALSVASSSQPSSPKQQELLEQHNTDAQMELDASIAAALVAEFAADSDAGASSVAKANAASEVNLVAAAAAASAESGAGSPTEATAEAGAGAGAGAGVGVEDGSGAGAGAGAEAEADADADAAAEDINATQAQLDAAVEMTEEQKRIQEEEALAKAIAESLEEANILAAAEPDACCPICNLTLKSVEVQTHIDRCLRQQEELKRELDKLRWECSFCAYRNDPAVDACDMCRTAKVSPAEKAALVSDANAPAKAAAVDAPVTCVGCSKSILSSQTHTLNACFDTFCMSCLKNHIDGSISGAAPWNIKCPNAKCNAELQTLDYLLLLDDKTLQQNWSALNAATLTKLPVGVCPEGSAVLKCTCGSALATPPACLTIVTEIEELCSSPMTALEASKVICKQIESALAVKCHNCGAQMCAANCGDLAHGVKTNCRHANLLTLHWILSSLDQNLDRFLGRTTKASTSSGAGAGSVVVQQPPAPVAAAPSGAGAGAGAAVDGAESVEEEAGDESEGEDEDEDEEYGQPASRMPKGIGYGGSSGANYGGDILKKEKEQKVIDDAVASHAECLRMILADRHTLSDAFPEAFARLYISSLTSILGQFLRNDALIELSRRSSIYYALFQLCRALGASKTFVYLLKPDCSSGSIFKLLTSTKRQADLFLKSPGALIQNADNATWDVVGLAADIKDVVEVVERYASEFTEKTKQIQHALATIKTTSAPKSSSASTEEKKQQPDQSAYEKFLESLQFQTIDILNGPVHHAHKTSIDNSSNESMAKGRMVRLRKEIASLMSNLPPGIFLRVDDDRLDVLRALIIGPHGTPYHNGCYLFDIFLPPKYPDVPPLVQYTTTGKGTFRFNPNLYACGKVCLSLLGTWSGPGWDPKVSTLLQVLVSIQAMILCDEPYYNEPGWERVKGTPEEYRAHHYNANISHGAMLFAMLDHLKAQPYGFEEVVRTHFFMKRNEIAEQLKVWKQQYDETNKKMKEKGENQHRGESHASVPFEKVQADLLAALKTLEPPKL